MFMQYSSADYMFSAFASVTLSPSSSTNNNFHFPDTSFCTESVGLRRPRSCTIVDRRSTFSALSFDSHVARCSTQNFEFYWVRCKRASATINNKPWKRETCTKNVVLFILDLAEHQMNGHVKWLGIFYSLGNISFWAGYTPHSNDKFPFSKSKFSFIFHLVNGLTSGLKVLGRWRRRSEEQRDE